MARFFFALLIAVAVFAPPPANANLVSNGDFATGDLTNWNLTAEQFSFGANASIITQTELPQLTANLNNPSFLLPNIAVGSVLGKNAWDDGSDLFYSAITQTVATTPGHTYHVQYVFEELSDVVSEGTLLAFFGSDPHLTQNTWVDSTQTGCNAFLSCLVPAPPLDQFSAKAPGPGIGTIYLAGTYVESFTDVATSTWTPVKFAGINQTTFLVTDIVVTDMTPLPEPSTIAVFGFGLLAAMLAAGRRRG